MTTLFLTSLLIASASIGFMVLERVAPGRELPNAPGWYGRAIFITLCQIGITLATGKLWGHLSGHASLFHLDVLQPAVLQGFAGWLIGTFFFYWWHRIRHLNVWWVLFHQVHHSPARIEALTSFYKHPVEMVADGALAAIVFYPLLGCSVEGGMWCAVFAAIAEFTYHSNFKSPHWMKYFIQTPELHSVHHQLDVHAGNYGDLPIWDRLFGTYRDADAFAAQCGFPRNNERHLSRMLAFQDVYDRS
jgi:sterol desaturase/sphingolipid hydroxylase (fatty acid hydroxylase superfamily)